MKHPDPLNLIITGVGGQGNVLISQILARALIEAGYQIVVGETFGLSQRGGSVQSHIRISKERVYGPLIPESGAHVILGLEPLETIRIIPKYGRSDLKVVINDRPIPPLNAIAGESQYPAADQITKVLDETAAEVWRLPGTKTATELGAAVMTNVVMLGALAGLNLIPLDPEALKRAMAEILPPGRLEMNIAAFDRGMELVGN